MCLSMNHVSFVFVCSVWDLTMGIASFIIVTLVKVGHSILYKTQVSLVIILQVGVVFRYMAQACTCISVHSYFFQNRLPYILCI